jgi:hypothetical protein
MAEVEEQWRDMDGELWSFASDSRWTRVVKS